MTRKRQTAFEKLYRAYVRGAKKRNLDFKLYREDFRKLTSSNCSYCGTPPSKIVISSIDEYHYNGIDRIANSIGYVNDNVQTCCYKCNVMKSSMTHVEFVEHVTSIAKYYNETEEKFYLNWAEKNGYTSKTE